LITPRPYEPFSHKGEGFNSCTPRAEEITPLKKIKFRRSLND